MSHTFARRAAFAAIVATTVAGLGLVGCSPKARPSTPPAEETGFVAEPPAPVGGTVTREGVTVTLAVATLKPVAFKGVNENRTVPLIRFELLVRNTRAGERIEFHRWGASDREGNPLMVSTLIDSAGTEYAPFRAPPGFVSGFEFEEDEKALAPGEQIRDVILFEPPANAESLILRLSALNVEGQEYIRFQVTPAELKK